MMVSILADESDKIIEKLGRIVALVDDD